MANFSNVGIFSLMFLILCSSSVQPAPHIPGAGWNTDIGGFVAGSQGGRSLLKSLLSSMRQTHNHDTPSSNVDTQVFSETTDEGTINSDVNESRSDRQIENVDQITEIRTPPPVVSSVEQRNPFLRQKREACRVPADLDLNQLQHSLNSTQYIGRSVFQSSRPIIPSGQPDHCHNDTIRWWPKQEVNLRSNCPWKYVEKDLGERAYPRYIREAKCLCDTCINSPFMGCQKLKQDVTYFEHTGCLDGLALMTKTTITIVVGCFCAHPSAPAHNVAVTTNSIPLPDHDD